MTFDDLLPEGWGFLNADFSSIKIKGHVTLENPDLSLEIQGWGYTFDEAMEDLLPKFVDGYVYGKGATLESVIPKGWGLYKAQVHNENSVVAGKTSVTLRRRTSGKYPMSEHWITYDQDSPLQDTVTRWGSSLDEAILKVIEIINNDL